MISGYLLNKKFVINNRELHTKKCQRVSICSGYNNLRDNPQLAWNCDETVIFSCINYKVITTNYLD